MRSYAITATAIEHYADALAQFDHLLGRLTGKETQRASYGELEAMAQAEGSKLLRRLIQRRLDQRWSEAPQRERVGADGIARIQRREGCKRRLETRFGEVIVTRRGYGGRGLESVFPLDAALNHLPQSGDRCAMPVCVDDCRHFETCFRHGKNPAIHPRSREQPRDSPAPRSGGSGSTPGLTDTAGAPGPARTDRAWALRTSRPACLRALGPGRGGAPASAGGGLSALGAALP